ncbi:MliC family protein [Paenochrobactrum pullorum]|uniref:MliC family protein n=1 Tax=Paenochrobactrum pullorum TaxID=1324351 RepID=UPI0035BBCA34
MMKSIALLTMGAGLILQAGVTMAQPAGGDTIQKVDYYCERNIVIPVTYINTAAGTSFAVLNVDGKQVSMTNAPSGSGALYIAIDEQDSYRWHEKAGEAVLSFLEADHTAEEQILLKECRADDMSEDEN